MRLKAYNSMCITRVDLDMKTAMRWRSLCLYKDISVIIAHTIAVVAT